MAPFVIIDRHRKILDGAPFVILDGAPIVSESGSKLAGSLLESWFHSLNSNGLLLCFFCSTFAKIYERRNIYLDCVLIWSMRIIIR